VQNPLTLISDAKMLISGPKTLVSSCIAKMNFVAPSFNPLLDNLLHLSPSWRILKNGSKNDEFLYFSGPRRRHLVRVRDVWLLPNTPQLRGTVGIKPIRESMKKQIPVWHKKLGFSSKNFKTSILQQSPRGVKKRRHYGLCWEQASLFLTFSA